MSPKKVSPEKPQDNRRNDSNYSSSQQDADSTLAKVAGVFFVLVGLTIIILLIVTFIISKLPYRTDPGLPIPTLEKLQEYTKEDSIDIKGSTIPSETVVLFENDKALSQKVKTDESGNFQFDNVELKDEGEYKYTASTVKGTIFKKRSEKSNEVMTMVDRSAPSKEVALEYEKENTTGTATISGEADKDSYVILKKDGQEYETEVDEGGKFTFEDLALESGKNVYEVSVRDKAGNEVLSSKKVEIEYTGSVNGDAATSQAGSSTALPESAGELERALEILAANKIMLYFGLAAVALFAGSGTLALNLSKRKK